MTTLLLFVLGACSEPEPSPPIDTDVPADTDVPTDTDLPTATDEPTPLPPTPEPDRPAGLTRWLTGAEADADVVPTGPALILMGGGAEPDQAFTWWNNFLAGGDVVVLRTTGSDGYNDYLFTDIGGIDSVETLLVDRRALANDPYVAWRIRHAEGIFLAGGDQSTYVDTWKATAVEDALHDAWARGAVIGGTSAGLAVLGDRSFSAANGGVYSSEALEDPYNTYMQFEDDFLEFAPLTGWITDSHFGERDRMGRLAGFVARWQNDAGGSPIGIGVDEGTAVLVGPAGVGRVVGTGHVYTLRQAVVQQCRPGLPLDVTLEQHTFSAGETLMFPSGSTAVSPTTLTVALETLTPADPY